MESQLQSPDRSSTLLNDCSEIEAIHLNVGRPESLKHAIHLQGGLDPTVVHDLRLKCCSRGMPTIIVYACVTSDRLSVRTCREFQVFGHSWRASDATCKGVLPQGFQETDDGRSRVLLAVSVSRCIDRRE